MVSAATQPTVLARAPARANLIGEHTDYNDGFVLPVALELGTEIVGVASGARIRLRSDAFAGSVDIDPVSGDGPMEGWGRHATAVVRSLRDAGVPMRGIDAVVRSDVPTGTGLSSSAAFEVALALAISERPLGAIELARICQRAENEHVGVRSGIMDPLVSAAAEGGAALFIDCRSLDSEPVPVPERLRVLVIDSGVRRELVGGDYNRRRAECEEAVRLLGVSSLRDADTLMLDAADLPQPFAARARHVVTENARVVEAREALRSDDRDALARLFAASHRSLAADFEVSTPELDDLVEIATGTTGVVAARMTGAGFGGCTVNLVDRDAATEAASAIVEAYHARTGRTGRAWISRAAPGALAVV
jgi:galactokinase